MLDKCSTRLAKNNATEGTLIVFDPRCLSLACHVLCNVEIPVREEKAMHLLNMVLPSRNVVESLRAFGAAPRLGDAMLGELMFRPRCSIRKLRQLVYAVGEGTYIGL